MNTLNLIKKEDYVIVELNRGKVNAIDSELMTELGQTFRDLEKDESVKGVILTGRPHCFSAGLDVGALLGGGADGARVFWDAYLNGLKALIEFSKPFVCAITGYAPAGATILALCADYRIMGKGAKHVMGMNEFNMSMQIPEMMGQVYIYHLGEVKAWEYAQTAKLFNSDEALAVGLVNESVEVEEVLERAEKQLARYIKVYQKTFVNTKAYFRKELLEIARNADISEMIKVIVADIEDPKTIAFISGFLAKLKRK
ncbi:MAG: 3,2-trans-enoyl-CoA isomerase [Paraglaciecola sp.]|jgi:3,2-trans-enoyl-CoA isomerase